MHFVEEPGFKIFIHLKINKSFKFLKYVYFERKHTIALQITTANFVAAKNLKLRTNDSPLLFTTE